MRVTRTHRNARYYSPNPLQSTQLGPLRVNPTDWCYSMEYDENEVRPPNVAYGIGSDTVASFRSMQVRCVTRQ